MASDIEQLVLSISADTRQVKRALDKLTGDSAKAAGDITRQFTAANSTTGSSFDTVAAKGSRAFTVIQGGAKQVNTAINSTRLQTGNLAAQFQDIGVQLAAGTSPFTILAQQLPQITMNGGSLNGVMGALKTTVSQLISPLGLATAAFVLLGSTAVSYFAELLTNSENSEEALKKQADLIQRVADRWGDAVPEIKAYADELKRAAEAGDLNAATAAVIARGFEETTPAIQNFKRAFVEATGPILDKTQGDLKRSFFELQKATKALQDEQKRGGDISDEFSRIQSALADIMANDAVGATGALRDAVNQLSAAYGSAAQNASLLAAAEANTQGLPGRQDRVKPGALGDLEFARRVGLDQYIDIPKPDTPKAGGTKAESEAERERKAVVKLIEALQFEQDMIGKTDEQRKVANELRKAGAYATDVQRLQIEQLVIATEQEREALQRSEEAMRALNDLGKDVLGGLVRDLREGKSGAEALANALDKVGDKLLDMALDGLFSSKQSSGGGFFGALLGGIGKLFGFAGGGYTGSSAASKPAGVVHGGEYVFSKKAVDRIGVPRLEAMHRGLRGYADGGLVMPSIRSAPSGGPAGGGYIDVSVAVGVENGSLVPLVTAISGQVAGQMVKQANKGFPNRAAAASARGT